MSNTLNKSINKVKNKVTMNEIKKLINKVSINELQNTLNKLTNKVSINELQNTLNNKLINRNDLRVKTTELSNELLETTKIIENCTSCKDKKIDSYDLDKIENCLAELEKEEQEWKRRDIIDELNKELFKINIRLNNEKFKRSKIKVYYY